jgi:oxygen-independent coproporphyrinogen III oxidase
MSNSLGLYVHLPFCRVHCTYCPFAVSTDVSLDDRYTAALVREILSAWGSVGVDTVYFGGGTPSRSSTANLETITAAIHKAFDVAVGSEFTMEANPEDVTVESLAQWRALGVNRISIGVQSFHDGELYPLGRGHRSDRARQAVADAVRSGMRTSLDLIAGLPGQTRSSFEESLRMAVESGVGHLSLYLLDLEEGTALYEQVRSGRAHIPDDEETAAHYLSAIETLERAGLRQYEISNFARPGQESRHNLRYWRRSGYLGFGMGAHSFGQDMRWANTRNITRYIEAIERGESAVEQREVLSEGERRREQLFLGLRQVAGLDYAELVELCGQEGVEWTTRGTQEGWLVRSDGRVAFTPSGFLLSNETISQLF